MLKKIVSLLLSLLVCLSLLPGQALASDESAPPVDPPAIEEPVDPEEPEEPGIMPMAEMPGETDVGATNPD